jgi:nitrogen regulatory protein P-II 1
MHDVIDELSKRDVHLVTATQVLGHGRQKGQAEVYRGHKEGGRLLKKVKLEIAVNEDYVQPAIEAINQGAKTGEGQIGDGKIFVIDLQECVRIRTGETGSVAIG